MFGHTVKFGDRHFALKLVPSGILHAGKNCVMGNGMVVAPDAFFEVVFFEDAVSWADLKRVFGVVFECYDQRRTPLDPRWFQGLPRVRVLLQAEPAELDRDESGAPSPTDPAPALARTLVILRDRGEGDVDVDAPTPGSRRRTPAPNLA